MLDAIPLGVWTDYLDWEGSLPSAMSLMELDGYMTGLAVTPSFQPGGRWRAELWGTDGQVPFIDEQHMRTVLDGLRLYYSDVLTAIGIGTDCYSPLCLPIEGDPDLNEVRTWATGFMLGMEYDPGYWQPRLADKVVGLLMAPITMFFPDFHGQYHDPVSQQERDAFPIAARTIPHSVCGLWKIGGKAIPAAKAKVGRNDPCPCGSGRKFKQCCGR